MWEDEVLGSSSRHTGGGMKTDLRTKLAEFDESVGATFDLISAVFANPDMDSEVTVRP